MDAARSGRSARLAPAAAAVAAAACPPPAEPTPALPAISPLQLFGFTKSGKTPKKAAPKYETVTVRPSFVIPTVLLGASGRRSGVSVPHSAPRSAAASKRLSLK